MSITTEALGAADATTTSKSAAGTKSLAQNFDTFLTMLTVQLKNQDPLSPMDSTEFTNQLVQFASVEQQINANANLEKLIASQSINTQSQLINYIGNSIEADTMSVPLQDGKAAFSVTLADEATSANAVIQDSGGKIVATLPLKATTDRQEVSWDGKDSDGNQLDDGAYKVAISAIDGTGKTVAAGVTAYGKVTDVASGKDSSSSLLGMNGVVVGIDKVLTVRDTASVN
ncbi:flagellar hook assembly protein FlgD [Magnetospirillum sp. UT-4]|uniref:flagellar hook assembly protein FlgD n=1 Tax=Magnetospirillum sp. UT-4 TaxID=2681467 RepID=UPI001380BB40|nr:flagellar hook capping FlgD N-terminal domain-containing protein [Magnetospirillum sp. UT-4]CAA7620067.1 Basal-body rod modification protein FlgD [Magnetospirillum sp. UT-4]